MHKNLHQILYKRVKNTKKSEVNDGENDINQCDRDFWSALDELVNNSVIIIDRPRGTIHPKYTNFVYQVDYGYLKDSFSMDGTGIDVWVGSDNEKKIDAIICIVDLLLLFTPYLAFTAKYVRKHTYYKSKSHREAIFNGF